MDAANARKLPAFLAIEDRHNLRQASSLHGNYRLAELLVDHLVEELSIFILSLDDDWYGISLFRAG